jgi:hypothetical protein
MARVPIQTLPEAQLTTQGPGMIQVSAGVEPMRNAAPEQAQQLGGAMQKAGNQMVRIADRLQGQLDDARANERFNQFSLYADEVEAGYLGTTGKQAIDGFQGVNASLTQRMQELSEGLDNDVQRMVFRESAGRRLRSVSTSATRHSISEQRRYNLGEREARIANHARAAGRYWDTRDEPQGDFNVYAGAAIRETEMLAQDLGYAPGSEQYNALIVKTQTGIHTMVAQTLIGENKFGEAMGYIEDAFESGEMEYAAYQQLRNTANVGFRREQGVNAAQRSWEGAGRVTGTDFDSAAAFVLGVEGGFVADDAGQGPGNLGILASANQEILNELGVDNVANLTTEQAKEIYKRNYWDAINADNLPPEVRMIAFDTAVNMGPGAARRLLRESGGDPARMIELRREHYARLVSENPGRFQQYARGWENRLRQLEGSIGRVGQEPPGGRYELPSLRDVLANIRSTVSDPEERQYAEAWATQTYNQEVALRDETYRATVQEAEDIAFAEGGSWQNIPPDMLSQLKPADRARLVEGAPRGDDPDTVIRLLDNPNLWRSGNIEQFRSQLSENTYQSFYSRGNSGNSDVTIRAATIDSEQFNATLVRNGFNNLVRPENDRQREDVIRLRDTFQRQIDQEQTARGRTLNLTEKQQILDNILMDRVMVEDAGFAWFDKEKTMFQLTEEQLELAYVNVGGEEIRLAQIPANERTDIIETLNRRGLPVNEMAIATMWVQAGKPGQRTR